MRLLALLAVTALGTGCYVAPCDSASITVDWQLKDASGVTRSCTTLGVAYVDVYLDGVLQVSAAPCLDGTATVFGVPSGSHDVVVEGVDASLFIVDRDGFTAHSRCGDSAYQVYPGEALLDVDYGFSPVNSCGSPPTYMWFKVTDVIANQTIDQITSTSSSSDKQGVACSTSAGVGVLGYNGRTTVPLGDYRLEYIGEVANPLAAPPTLLFQDCTPSTVSARVAGTFALPATLTDATGQVSCLQ